MLTGLNFLQHTQQWICSKFSLKMPQHLKCQHTVIYDLPLITIIVSNCHLFYDITISQGSVAMHLMCGGIFSYHFTANLSLSLIVKEFWKSVKIWQSYRYEFGGPLFLEHCTYVVLRCSLTILVYKRILVDCVLRNVWWCVTYLYQCIPLTTLLLTRLVLCI